MSNGRWYLNSYCLQNVLLMLVVMDLVLTQISNNVTSVQCEWCCHEVEFQDVTDMKLDSRRGAGPTTCRKETSLLETCYFHSSFFIFPLLFVQHGWEIWPGLGCHHVCQLAYQKHIKLFALNFLPFLRRIFHQSPKCNPHCSGWQAKNKSH